MDRLISLIIFIVCLVLMYINGAFSPSSEEILKDTFWLVMFGIFSFALIWFGDEAGAFTGWMGRVPITKKTPGCLVKFIGWLFLLVFAFVVIGQFLK